MLLWWKAVERAQWENFADVKAQFNSADSVGDGRIVFNVGGNKYRIVGRLSYNPHYRVLIKFVGTHSEYDRIDARSVENG
jgi:mRNA interferase HigB